MPDPMIVDWPLEWWQPKTGQFNLAPRSQMSKAPWTQTSNVYGPHVQYWCAKLSFATLSDAAAAEREAMVEMLGGQAGLLRIGSWPRRRPLYDFEVEAAAAVRRRFTDTTDFTDGTGYADGYLPASIPCVEAAARGARSVVVGALPASTVRVLRRGDHVEFQRGGVWDSTPSLHRVTRDAPTDPLGRTRIEFVPPLRKGIAAGDRVSLRYPASVFRLVGDDEGIMDRDVNAFGSFGFSLVENLI